MKNYIILVLAIFLFSGCATSKTACISNLDKGLTKAQVLDRWGQPHAIQTVQNSAQKNTYTEKWYYLEQDLDFAKLPERSVIFEDGKTAHSFVY
jgi:outer membrane protein assembly factor BamE (lipoprotein component of BamABCDE complex)